MSNCGLALLNKCVGQPALPNNTQQWNISIKCDVHFLLKCIVKSSIYHCPTPLILYLFYSIEVHNVIVYNIRH